jgi:hypothetical protein
MYSACSNACSSFQKEMADGEAKRRADEQRAHDEAVAADTAREAANAAAIAAKRAQDELERSLDASARMSLRATSLRTTSVKRSGCWRVRPTAGFQTWRKHGASSRPQRLSNSL